MVIPDHIANAAQAADIEAVREWLTTNDVNDRATDTPGRNNFYQGGYDSGQVSAKMVALLLGTDKVQILLKQKTLNCLTPLALAIGKLGAYHSLSGAYHSLRIVALLLRAGASLDAVRLASSAEEYLQEEEEESAGSEQFVLAKELILGVRAAGSWRAYTKLPRKQVLRLRSLALRDRAEPRSKVITFLVKSPNEIAWNVLAYWRTERDEWLDV